MDLTGKLKTQTKILLQCSSSWGFWGPSSSSLSTLLDPYSFILHERLLLASFSQRRETKKIHLWNDVKVRIGTDTAKFPLCFVGSSRPQSLYCSIAVSVAVRYVQYKDQGVKRRSRKGLRNICSVEISFKVCRPLLLFCHFFFLNFNRFYGVGKRA